MQRRLEAERNADGLDEVSRPLDRQRRDAERLKFADDIDYVYTRAARAAIEAGVEMLCYRCHVGLDGIQLADAIPITAPA